MIQSEQQWDYPNGWPVFHSIIYELNYYDF